jgi:hypothetical protein
MNDINSRRSDLGIKSTDLSDIIIEVMNSPTNEKIYFTIGLIEKTFTNPYVKFSTLTNGAYLISKLKEKLS